MFKQTLTTIIFFYFLGIIFNWSAVFAYSQTTPSPDIKQIVVGIALDEVTKSPIKGALIQIIEPESGQKKYFSTSGDGSFFFKLKRNGNYIVNLLHPKGEILDQKTVTARFEDTEVFTVSLSTAQNSQFVEQQETPKLVVIGSVLEKKQRMAVKGAYIQLTDLNSGQQEEFVTKDDGNFFFNLDANKQYNVKLIDEAGKVITEQDIDTANNGSHNIIHIYLEDDRERD